MKEVFFWLQDMSKHLSVYRRRKKLRQPGAGIDYKNEKTDMHQIVSRLHPKRMKLRVIQILQNTPSTKTFQFERLDGPLPPFRPGQYINVFVDVDGVLTSRPYSIASPPGSEILEITVRDKPNGFVAPYLLNEVHLGDELESSGPSGTFYHELLIDGKNLVFLAGGSGITPFMSIIRDVILREEDLNIHLLYGSRTANDVIYADELEHLATNHSNFEYTLVISEPEAGKSIDDLDIPCLIGFLDADLIRQQVGVLKNKTFYVCGPQAMYPFCLDALSELGIPAHKIKRELYGPPADVTCEPSWPSNIKADAVFKVEVNGFEKVLQAPAIEPLLNVLERYGLVLPAICRTGECSACRVRLLSGQVFMPAHTGIREADHKYGYIHACVSYALEDLHLMI